MVYKSGNKFQTSQQHADELFQRKRIYPAVSETKLHGLKEELLISKVFQMRQDFW